jgi:hypothetical protein
MRIARLLLLAGLAATLSAAAPSASAATRGVKDNGKMFSAPAIEKANAQIDDIFRRHHAKEVYIETFDAVPGDGDVGQFVQQQFEAARLNGVYIAVIKKGGHVSVRVDPQTHKLFTDTVCAELAQRMVANFKQRKNDDALLNGVQFIADTFDRGERQGGGGGAGVGGSSSGAYVPPAAPPSRTNVPASRTPGIFSSLWGWVCLILGIWLVVALVRSVFRRSGGGGYPGGGPGYGPGPGYGGYGGGYGGGGYGYGGGGGGWGSSLLGGLFGAAAGSWMYDRFFRGGSSAYGAPPDTGGGGYAGGGGGASTPDWAAPGDSGMAGGGGADASFGDSGGGGGGGGGDFGGGGGGDAGGGGDFA